MHAVLSFLRRFPALYRLSYGILRGSFRISERLVRYDYENKKNPSVSLEKIRRYNQHRKYGPSRHLCHAPYTNMHFRLNGDVNACCYNMTHSLGNIRDQSIRDIWNGQKAKELREYVDNYNLDHGCSFCKYQLEAENHTGMYAGVFDELPFTTKADTGYPSEMTFEITNVCNLECLMCTGDYSNLIRKNREKKTPLPLLYKERFLEELKEFLPHLKKATFLGGEPLLIRTYFEIWKYLAVHNPDCRIYVQTNATILTDEFLDLLKSGKYHIGVSIDAWSPDLFESIRKNASWQTVMRHLDDYTELHRQRVIELSLNFCPMINNWQDIPALIEAANERDVAVTLLTVITPPFLSLRSCPSAMLQRIIGSLKEQVVPGNSAVARRNHAAFEGLIAQLETWLERQKERELDDDPGLTAGQLRDEFSRKLLDTPTIGHLSGADKQGLVQDVEAMLQPYDDNTRRRAYRSLIQTIDYFFDDSLENLQAGELREGFSKFINWELDGIRYEQGQPLP